MLVMDEDRHPVDTMSPKAYVGAPYKNLTALKFMILRDRNHPSIIMWSMCNEEGLVVTRQGAAIFKAMRNAVHEIDPTRPVMCAQNPGWPKFWGKNMNARLVEIEDLQGINYQPHLYSEFHALHPKMPMVGSEITSGGLSVRGIYPWNSAPDFGSRYSANYNWPWESWYPIAKHPFVMGGFVWTGFDYRGEPNPSNYPDVSSNFGLMDLCGFPKDTYYYFKAEWIRKPLVHFIPSNWNWPGHLGQAIGIRIYSNCQQVKLFLNGKCLAKMKMPPTGFVDIGWPGYYHANGYYVVHYQPGTLEACGYDHGKLVATDIVKTTGKPTHLVLRSPMRYVRADGEDVALVEAAVEDAKERVVPNANNMLHFAISGPGAIAGACNGNSHCLEPNLADYHRAFNGLCQLEVRAGTHPGVIRVTVSAGGLAAGTLSIPCVKAGVYALPPHGTY
jgi:beta-galactosidase